MKLQPERVMISRRDPTSRLESPPGCRTWVPHGSPHWVARLRCHTRLPGCVAGSRIAQHIQHAAAVGKVLSSVINSKYSMLKAIGPYTYRFGRFVHRPHRLLLLSSTPLHLTYCHHDEQEVRAAHDDSNDEDTLGRIAACRTATGE